MMFVCKYSSYFCLFFFFLDRVSLYSLGCPRTCSVDRAGWLRIQKHSLPHIFSFVSPTTLEAKSKFAKHHRHNPHPDKS